MYTCMCNWVKKLTEHCKPAIMGKNHFIYMYICENILRERRQSQKTIYYIIPFIWMAGIGKLIEEESRLMVA